MGLCLPSGSSLNTKGTGQGYLLDKGKITGPMNILFATIAFPENIEQHNIYTDLMEELRDQGHDFLCCLSL